MLNERNYKYVRVSVLLILPILASVYYATRLSFGMQTDNVLGAIVVITALLGILLSTRDKNSNYDGEMIVEEKDGGGQLATLALGSDPEVLFNKDRIVFKVVKNDSHI